MISVQGPREAHRPLGGRLTAEIGRVSVVWLVVALVAGAERPLNATGLLAVSAAAAIWLVTQHAAFAGTMQALGAAVPATIGATSGLVCVAALNPFLPGLELSLPTLLAMWLGVLLSSIAWETVVARAGGKRRVLIVGSGSLSETDIAARARDARALAVEVLGGSSGALPPRLAEATAGRAAGRSAVTAAPLDDLALTVSAQRPDLVVLTDESACADAVDRLLEIRHPHFRVAGLTSFYEQAFGCVPLPHLTPLWFMGLLALHQPAHRPSKRVFDIVVAGLGLLLAAPLIAILALAIKRTPGPVIYRQTRVGERGRRFTIYKLRTMTQSAEQPGQAVWAQERDPRATGIGRCLRRTHLDELPQLWNVLRGDMSIVGPRPERPEFIEMLEDSVPFWNRRLLIRPGLTGWAQVRCGYADDSVTSAEKLSYDFWYLRHGSLAVDVAVCVRTALLMLGGLVPRRARVQRQTAREHASP